MWARAPSGKVLHYWPGEDDDHRWQKCLCGQVTNYSGELDANSNSRRCKRCESLIDEYEDLISEIEKETPRWIETYVDQEVYRDTKFSDSYDHLSAFEGSPEEVATSILELKKVCEENGWRNVRFEAEYDYESSGILIKGERQETWAEIHNRLARERKDRRIQREKQRETDEENIKLLKKLMDEYGDRLD